MLIAFATPEVYPYSKTGGLGDVSAALPEALAAIGHEVVVFSPCYRQTREYFAANPPLALDSLRAGNVWIGDEQHELSYLVVRAEGPTQVFCVHDFYYDRQSLYTGTDGRGYPDNAARYSYFCRAVLAYLTHQGLGPDIIHCNDWQTALLLLYLQEAEPGDRLASARTVLTIHNLGFQGTFPAEQIYATGLSWERFNVDELEFYGSLNLLKGGIAAADAVTTVSPTYAQEIQTPEFGFGLDGFLKNYSAKLRGILNGIDDATWNPATDPLIPANYDVADLAGKARCKADLQRVCNLRVDESTFLLGMVSRLDRQKGSHLIAEFFPKLASQPLQLVILGTGSGEITAMFGKLAARFPDQVVFHNKYDEALAHLIEAGSDAFLMPSAYEPCGLNQLYSQRYGTVPIVRDTGGLKDTVTNCTPARLARGTASGFSFRKLESAALTKAVKSAAQLYFTDPSGWRQLVTACMLLDHGWRSRAEQYAALYRELAANSSLRSNAGG